MEGVLMTGTAHVSATPYSQPVLPTHISQITQQINFAPTAPAQKLVLKSWERQPSTAFLARHKSRKIWKRFRRSMEALRGRRIATPTAIEESEFVKEISQSANAEYVRAVKRQRLRSALHNGDNDDDNEEGTERGRSFLETKWELETGRKKRKMVALPECVEREAEGQLVAVGHDAENEAGGSGVVVRSLDETSHDVALSTASEAEVENSASEDDSADHGAVISEIVDLAVDAPGSETVAEVRELIAKQETTLVRSALRMNSLDGDDAALLSEFLSRAQAKRAANAAMVSDESKNVIQKNGSDEDKEGSEEQVAATLRSPVVQSRRALEELDVNSPSIQKQLTSSPVKAEKEPESPNASEPGEDISSPTVLRRRSTRTKPSKAQQTRSLPPAVPNQIPVRRANGTEFVFLQRTEAHDLALTTRKNTRRNKGNSILPKYLLQAMSRQESSEESLSAEEKEKSQSRKHAGSKQVCWRDEQLVEFAPERTFQALESPKKSSTSRREGSKPRQETTAMTNQALPATPSKKVRRVNMAAMNSNNTTTDTNSATANKSVAAGTPIPKRKKLIPRVPRGSVAATATATATATNTSTSTNTAKPSSQHPSKTPSAATTTAPTSVNRQSSAVSSSQHTAQKASGIPRSKTLSKTAGASSAGATPMVKRMRARRTAV